MPAQTALVPEKIFGDSPVAWGNKYPPDTLLADIWSKDRGYLIWAADLDPKKRCDRPIPAEQASLIRIAALASSGEQENAAKLFKAFKTWREHTQLGVGLENLPRPTQKQCRAILKNTSILGVHWDLDGIYSGAIAIARGGALDAGKAKGAFQRIKLLRYGIKSIKEYGEILSASAEDTVVIIDYAAYPGAALNLDHHPTSLSFWELGTPPPTGVFEPTMPSCPRLLATFCGLEVSEEVLSGCDMVDGARYTRLEQTYDLSNPFVALEYALSVDVSEPVAKKVLLTLAENDLDPQSILTQKVWQARLALVLLEMDEQRTYWQRDNRFKFPSDLLAIADGRSAPHSSTRFRYFPFENEDVIARPYLITLRPPSNGKLNVGISRNPFFHDADFFYCNQLNLGALAKRLGRGGGRQEAASVTIDPAALSATIDAISQAVSASTESPE